MGRAAAEKSTDTTGPHYSEFEVDLKRGLSGDQTKKAQQDIRKALSEFIGMNFAINTFLAERIEETLSGYTAPVAVDIFGNNLELLDQKAQEIAKVLSEVPQARDVQVNRLRVCRNSPSACAKPTSNAGASYRRGARFVRTAYQGDVVGQTYQGNQIFDVIAIVDDATRRNIAAVGNCFSAVRAELRSISIMIAAW